MIASIFETPAKPDAKRSGEGAPAATDEMPRESDDVESEQIGAADVDEVAVTDRDRDYASSDDAESNHEADETGADEGELDEVARAEAEPDQVAEQAVAQDGETLPPLEAGSIATMQIATTEIVEITFTTTPEPATPTALRDDGSENLDALTRYGPGPLEALRFKWSVRRKDDDYYVDETIGTSSQPITAGPFSRAEAVAFIDDRDRRTRRRFERLRNEIVSGPSERGVEDDDDETL